VAFPVSIKGVIAIGGRIPLLRNERQEWELPGGRLETGEQPIDCVAREIREELAIDVEPLRALDSWLYRVRPDRDVLIVTYGCRSLAAAAARHSHEHNALSLFAAAEIAGLAMPDGYKRSIQAWLAEIARTGE
jgi:8-oxo-dGTP pyrophosphatase MutT (NUDIX family)